MPARRSVAKSCSRNWTGMSRRRASSPIGTGVSPPVLPSSVRAFRAYGLLAVIESIGLGSLYGSGKAIRAGDRADGAHLLPLGAARSELGARRLGPRPAQARAHDRVRAAVP